MVWIQCLVVDQRLQNAAAYARGLCLFPGWRGFAMPADSSFFFGPLPSASGCSLGVVGELNKGRFMHQAGDCGQLATNLCEQLPHVATQLQVSTDALEVRISTSRCLGISGHDHQDIKKLLFLESTSCANASRSMNFDYPLLAWGMQEGPCGFVSEPQHRML